jgi:hypothetical protein
MFDFSDRGAVAWPQCRSVACAGAAGPSRRSAATCPASRPARLHHDRCRWPRRAARCRRGAGVRRLDAVAIGGLRWAPPAGQGARPEAIVMLASEVGQYQSPLEFAGPHKERPPATDQTEKTPGLQRSANHRTVNSIWDRLEDYFPSRFSVRSCNFLINPSAPPEAMIEANSSRRSARSLIVPLR